MEIFEILKQLKNIEPDAGYSAVSRRAILAMEPEPAVRQRWSARRTVLHIIETGVAVALTGFFILLLTGAFSGSSIAPVQYSAIDPASLRAEAQAIDIQVQLANLKYAAASSSESTSPLAPRVTGKTVPKTSSAPKNNGANGVPMGAVTGTPSTTAVGTVSIDQALQSLSQ